MICSACSHDNRAGAKFCEECASPLLRKCPTCGADVRPAAKFCDACGTALVARPADKAEARKVVTIVFADIIGSTSLHERLDAESARRLMDRYYQALRAAVEAHGGTVVKLLGDGVVAAFGVPLVAEDDAIRALRGAAGMQQAFRDLVHEQTAVVGDLGLRVGVNTGEVVVSADNTDIVGDPVNVAARLQQEACDGEVLIGESTQRLVRELVTLAPFGALTLKGRSETVAAYRVVSLERPAGAPAIAFVGRDDELGRIKAVYDAAVTAPGARLVLILGSPGLGKSRLLDEFGRRLGDGATVLTARCDPAGGATFAPLARALRALLRIDDGSGGDGLRAAVSAAVSGGDAEHIRIADGITALLAGTPAAPEETFFVVRRLLAAFAAAQPVVLAVDDLQWAEPLLLDLIEHLIQWSSGVPLLVLAAARPELRDTRSSLASTGGLVADVVTLAGLDAVAASRLAANVIGADALPAAVAGRVLATSEGNPLFLGELVRMLVNDGALKRDGDRWTTGVDLAALDMPPTIHALLAARIERLRPEDRIVLERAAVVGRQFSRAAVAHLLPREAQADLDARLEALRRSELIEPDASWFLGEPGLRFHHGLTRDAAYRRVLKGTRAELHGRCAEWTESRAGDAVEHDETIGWHLEQAHQHLRELGPIDEHGRQLGERAARYLAAAGRRALARDDLPVAANLLGRSLDRLDDADPGRAELALDWCEALLSAGDVGHARGAIDELGRWVGESPRALPWADVLPPFQGCEPAEANTEQQQLQRGGNPLARGNALGGVVAPAASGPKRLRAWHTCFTGQLAVLTDPQALRATIDAVAGAADELATAGDAAGEAKAHWVHAQALVRLGQVGACEAALDRALAAARRAGDRRRANAVLAGAPLAALWGPSPVTRASGRCLDVVRVLRITQGAPAVEAVALRCQAVLEALRGRTDAARRMLASSRGMVEELGIIQQLLETEMFAGLIELLEADAAAAERCLRSAYEGLRNHGLGIDAARAAALLGRALLAQGRAAEAEALSHESEALAGDDLKAAIAWRGVRAEALAQRGEHVAAVELARAAVAIAAATDALLDHADARLALAAALHAASRSDEAAAEETRAIELWEAKGATLLAERARRAAGRAAQGERAPNETHAEFFEPERREQGFGRRGALVPAAPGDLPAKIPTKRVPRPLSGMAPRTVRENHASIRLARLHAAVEARDADALAGLLADDLVVVHHVSGLSYGREEGLNRFRLLFRTEDLAISYEPLAVLGDFLLLLRDDTSFDRFVDDEIVYGASRSRYVNVLEVNDRGQSVRVEIFAETRLGDAIARLYERCAELLPEGPARARAAATAGTVAAVLGPFDLARYATGIAPNVEFVDHRTVGFPSGRGVEELLRSVGSLLETADNVATRVDDVLALSPNAFLVRWRTLGTDRISGGPFEWHFLRLCVFGADGLLLRAEQFDVDRADEALARFDELSKGSTSVARVENAATRTTALVDQAWTMHDWEGFAALFDAGFRNSDRRWMVQLDLDRDQYLDSIRRIFEITSNATDVLATRGNRLAMLRVRWKGNDDQFGSSEGEFLLIAEVDDHGKCVALVHFDPDDLGAAYAELEQRYAGEATSARRAALTRAFTHAFAARDWDALATLLAPDLVVNDHRLLGWETLHGPAAYIEALKSLVDLAPDVQLRVDHLTMSDPRFLYVTTWVGTREGGAFETPSVIVCELDEKGRIRRFDQHDIDQLAEVRARFENLGEGGQARDADASLRSSSSMNPQCDVSPPHQAGVRGGSARLRNQLRPEHAPNANERRRPDPTQIPPNAASRARDHVNDAFLARRWDTMRSLASDDMAFEDRRKWSMMSGGSDLWIKSSEQVQTASGVALNDELIGSLGDRIELRRRVVTGTAPDGGAFESEFILLTETGADGRLTASINFDVEARGEAFAEAHERFAAGEAAGSGEQRPIAVLNRAIARHDWNSLAECLAADAVIRDRRTLGLGTFSRDDWIASLRTQAELAPHMKAESFRILAWNGHGRVDSMRVVGTARDGGAFEKVFVAVYLVIGGHIRHHEVFDRSDIDRALARFEELCAAQGGGTE